MQNKERMAKPVFKDYNQGQVVLCPFEFGREASRRFTLLLDRSNS